MQLQDIRLLRDIPGPGEGLVGIWGIEVPPPWYAELLIIPVATKIKNSRMRDCINKVVSIPAATTDAIARRPQWPRSTLLFLVYVQEHGRPPFHVVLYRNLAADCKHQQKGS